jgi:hypothetical protein
VNQPEPKGSPETWTTGAHSDVRRQPDPGLLPAARHAGSLAEVGPESAVGGGLKPGARDLRCGTTAQPRQGRPRVVQGLDGGFGGAQSGQGSVRASRPQGRGPHPPDVLPSGCTANTMTQCPVVTLAPGSKEVSREPSPFKRAILSLALAGHLGEDATSDQGSSRRLAAPGHSRAHCAPGIPRGVQRRRRGAVFPEMRGD